MNNSESPGFSAFRCIAYRRTTVAMVARAPKNVVATNGPWIKDGLRLYVTVIVVFFCAKMIERGI